MQVFYVKSWHVIDLPQIHMGNLRFNLGQVKYDVEGHSSFPREAKIGLGVSAALLVPVVLIIIFMYRYVLNWQIFYFFIFFILGVFV